MTNNNLSVEQQNIEIDEFLSLLGQFLKGKNIDYGGNALNPTRIFSKAEPIEGIRIRLDDKISRIMRGEDAGEDPVLDFIGYLVLEKVGQKIHKLTANPYKEMTSYLEKSGRLDATPTSLRPTVSIDKMFK